MEKFIYIPTTHASSIQLHKILYTELCLNYDSNIKVLKKCFCFGFGYTVLLKDIEEL